MNAKMPKTAQLPQSRKPTGGKSAALAMVVLFLLMVTAFSVVWVVPSPLQAPLQQSVNALAQSISGGSSQTTISGLATINDPYGGTTTIKGTSTPLSGLWFIGPSSTTTLYDSNKSASGSVQMTSVFNLVPTQGSLTSWSISGNMVVSLDGVAIKTIPISNSGTIAPNNIAVGTATFTSLQIANYVFNNNLPAAGASVQPSTHTLTVAVQGTVTTQYSGASSATSINFNSQLITMSLTVSPNAPITTTTTTSGGGGSTTTTTTTSGSGSFTIQLNGSSSSTPA